MQMWSNRRRDKLHIAQSGLSGLSKANAAAGLEQDLVPLKWSGRVEVIACQTCTGCSLFR
jgi:hypothetical protein